MIELRWREVEHVMSQRNVALIVQAGPWPFVLEYREWSEQARDYSAWKPVPVVWLSQVGGAIRGKV